MTGAVVCDDLTGSLEVVSQFEKAGVTVRMRLSRLETPFDGISVFSTETRNLGREDCAAAMDALCAELRRTGSPVLFKKVDSTLRGHVGLEIERLLSGTTTEMAVLCPALPHLGRTTENGVHYVDGRPLSECDIAKDPLSPVAHSYIPDLLKTQTALRSAVVELRCVRGGEKELRDRLFALRREGVGIAVCDARTESDLRAVAEAALDPGLLVCGSAGLASALLATGRFGGSEPPLLVLSGSPAAGTKRQIAQAEAAGFAVLRVHPRIFDPDGLSALTREASAILRAGQPLIVDAAGAGKAEIAAAEADPQRMAAHSESLLRHTAALACHLLREHRPGGLMLIGGDTGRAVLGALGATELAIFGECEPYVPVGAVMLDGLPMPFASKAGGFGSDNVIQNAAVHLRMIRRTLEFK